MQEVHRHAADFLLAVSRPCFELWLYLHHAAATEKLEGMSCRKLTAELRIAAGGYSKTALDTDSYRPHVSEAVARAQELDVLPQERWPNQLGTRVYRVIEAIWDRQ